MPTPKDLTTTPLPQFNPSSSKRLQWFLPTFHGDILLERKDDKTTLVRVFELTESEEVALQVLRKRATAKPILQGKPWADDKEFLPVTSPLYRTKDGLVLTLSARIEEVEKVLSKALNPKNRALFSAVRFSDGTIEKIHRLPDADESKSAAPLTTYRDNAKDADKPDAPEVDAEVVTPEQLAAEKAEKDKAGKKEKAIKKKEPEAAATVKQPVIGCPTPEFPEADIRATRALTAFLDGQQIADYQKHGAFVTVGRDTGHRYLVCNRERPHPLRKGNPLVLHVPGASTNGLWDLDENRALCVHDWDVPPPEEMLALHLCLSIPGYERYVRTLPHAYG